MNNSKDWLYDEGKKSHISIIVPVYNAEKYLEQCINSLYEQTYDKLEIICINDGSTDNSLQILEKWASKDSRIIIIDKFNEGVSRARNIGLEKATGEFVMFVDADDWIEKTTCERVVFIQQETNADVVMWSYISERKQQSIPKSLFGEDKIIFDNKKKIEELHRRFFGLIEEELGCPEKADSQCPVWGKLYRRGLIERNNIEFVDIKDIGTYEDGLFNIEYFGYIQKAVYVQKYYYHYRRTNEESVTSGYKENFVTQWEHLYQLMNTYIQENRLSCVYENAVRNRIALGILGLSINSIQSGKSSIQQWKEIKKLLSRDNYREAIKVLPLTYFPFYWKVFYGCAKINCATGIFCLVHVIKKIIK